MKFIASCVSRELMGIKYLNKFCSVSVPSTYLAKHINMLLKEAELRVDDLTTAVVHVSYTASSEIKVMRIVVKVFFFIFLRWLSICTIIH